MKILIEREEELEALRSSGTIEVVTELSLGNLNLGYFPEWVCEYPFLERLTITGNQIKEIPECIEKLSGTLVTLDVGNNEITKLPSCIGQFKKLENLFIYNNLIKELPSEVGSCSSMKVIHGDGNPDFFSVPKSIGNLHNLIGFCFRSCSLSSLPYDMKNCTKLESIELRANKFTTLPKCIPNLIFLRELDLMFNQFSPGEIEAIKKSLPNISKLYL
ncbi:hypothetical protein M445_00410 [Vibrio owensii 47666-1]|uniref:leucine-rich repeat domain-containing protein n=1 Tax=Vibrio harveyi group TaxID=717610 RepID=UPI000584633D|nr:MULTISPECIES: leucine-rich repeat domain-containing protein [Vibrio harveyi group]KIF50330.1 hypothetical protein M445_00410 [Vibrio owensii 47666-1]TOR08570.1 leucine-rich repeat domain-containing protein [Vibrio parahaemolyticus]